MAHLDMSLDDMIQSQGPAKGAGKAQGAGGAKKGAGPKGMWKGAKGGFTPGAGVPPPSQLVFNKNEVRQLGADSTAHVSYQQVAGANPTGLAMGPAFGSIQPVGQAGPALGVPAFLPSGAGQPKRVFQKTSGGGVSGTETPLAPSFAGMPAFKAQPPLSSLLPGMGAPDALLSVPPLGGLQPGVGLGAPLGFGFGSIDAMGGAQPAFGLSPQPLSSGGAAFPGLLNMGAGPVPQGSALQGANGKLSSAINASLAGGSPAAIDEQSATMLLESAKQVASTMALLGHKPPEFDGILASLNTLDKSAPDYAAKAVEIATAISSLAAAPPAASSASAAAAAPVQPAPQAPVQAPLSFVKGADGGVTVRKTFTVRNDLTSKSEDKNAGVRLRGTTSGASKREKSDPRSIDLQTYGGQRRLDVARSARQAAKEEQLARMRGTVLPSKKIIRDEKAMTREDYAQQGRTKLKLKHRFDGYRGIKQT